jgi:hypothetical protein
MKRFLVAALICSTLSVPADARSKKKVSQVYNPCPIVGPPMSVCPSRRATLPVVQAIAHRYVPSGRRGAPSGTQGGGSRRSIG